MKKENENQYLKNKENNKYSLFAKQSDKQMARNILSEYRQDPVMQADITKWDTGVTYDDNLLMQPSKPRDNSLGQIDDQSVNGEDLDDDAVNPGDSYEDQASALEDQDFQMNLDDM